MPPPTPINNAFSGLAEARIWSTVCGDMRCITADLLFWDISASFVAAAAGDMVAVIHSAMTSGPTPQSMSQILQLPAPVS